MSDERTEAGDPVFRHAPREKPFEFAIGDSANIESISNHITHCLGPVATVWHEVISDLVHIDVHVVAPTAPRPFYSCVTSGMSDRPMKVPENTEVSRYVELYICLPPTWKMGQEDFKQSANYWPIGAMKGFARMPHEYQTFICPGQTASNGNPPSPFDVSVKFDAVFFGPGIKTPREFRYLDISPEKRIEFIAVYPLYPEELQLRLKKGTSALVDGFVKHKVTEVVDPNRKNVAALGFFNRFF